MENVRKYRGMEKKKEKKKKKIEILIKKPFSI